MSGEDWDVVLKTNLDGFYNVLNPLIMPMMRRRAPGRIVTITSLSGLIGNRGQVNYSAAKALSVLPRRWHWSWRSGRLRLIASRRA
jgi:3-oxoacyl-[acyl-carrier protein] reductase